MSELVAALDEVAASSLVADAEAALPPLSTSGSGSLGPFVASYSASATITGGSVDLIAPNVVRLANVHLNYSLGLTVGIDLGSILPEFCLPRICVTIPFIGRVCTPRICIDWPVISIPISHSGTINFTGDFSLALALSGGFWKVDIVVVGVPFLQIDPEAALILAAIGSAAALALLAVPFIGPFLSAAALAITAGIGIAGVTGLLGPILTPFVSGLRFHIYDQPQIFEVLPASGGDAAVHIRLDALNAQVVSSTEDELVFSADISPA